MRSAQTAEKPAAALSPTVKALGFVSLFADVSSEMVYPINPVFLTTVLHAPAWTVGIIEGAAECVASVLKLYSGWVSDRIGKRKGLTGLGYALGAIGKPLIALSTLWPHVLGARLLDRVGKGLRSAPRDALITENCAPEQRGRAFGFHRGMDTTGAVCGPLIAFLFLRQWPGEFRHVYWLAFVPGAVGVVVLAIFVRERAAAPAVAPARKPISLPSWGSLSPAYRRYLWIVGLFSLGNSSDAFLLLRAKDCGVATAHLLLIYAMFNVVEATLAYPTGVLSDKLGRRPLVALGYGVFMLVYLGFALEATPLAVWGLFVVYGFYYTLTGGVQRALAADLAHADRRATEIGAFHMLVGIAALPASLMAGWLYSVSRPAPFLLGAGCAGAAMLLLLMTRLDKPAADQ